MGRGQRFNRSPTDEQTSDSEDASSSDLEADAAMDAAFETGHTIYGPIYLNLGNATSHRVCRLKGVLMTARTIASRDAHDTQTRLERGTTYRATTTAGETTGEYLGMEAPHGDLAILLRDGARGVHSIELDYVTSIERLAA